MFYEQVAHLLIGTPLQQPAEALKYLLGIPKRYKNPELREVFVDARRIRQLIRETVRDGMNCIDVGCHLGSVLEKFCRLHLTEATSPSSPCLTRRPGFDESFPW